METFYPSDLPLPKIEGFSAEVASGLIKTETPTHQAQRRVFSTMPHRFSLTFILSFQKWATWYSWASGNGYRWFDLELPTMYAGMVSADIAPITVRFVSDIVASKVSLTDVQVTVMAESAPSAMIQRVTSGAESLLGVTRNNYEPAGIALDFTDNSSAVRI